MPKKSSRIAFIFTSTRDGIISGMRVGQEADTALRGMNHIPGAKYFTILPKSMRSLLFVPRLLRYDFVIAQDNFLLGYIVSLCARAFGLPTKWLYVAMTSSTLMRRHATNKMRLFLFKKFWASYARIICLSGEQLSDFVQFGIPRERLVFVPFGVDTSFFQSTDTAREEDIIMSVGRDAGRDYATLFKAAERTNHVFVVVAGHKNIPHDMLVPTNVSVLYDRSLVDVRNLYARAKLVVVASKDVRVPDGSDCSGQTVILDALSAGKAVIATDRAWIKDYFVKDEDLVIVPPSDPEALAKAIESLINNRDKRVRLGQSGRLKVSSLYSTEKFAKSILELINSEV